MGDSGQVPAPRLRGFWRVAWLLGLAAVFLAPALRTGYIAEDLGQSVMPRGSSVLDNKTLGDTINGHVKHTMLNGRFFPLTPALISTVHYAIRDARTYKAYIVALGVLDLFLFYLLLARLTGRRDFACFAACVTVGLFQYRVGVDPSLGFFGQMQLLIAALFLSLLTLQAALDGRGRGWLPSSVGLYLACALLYEVSYALVPLHLCLILRAYPDRGRRGRAALPFLGVIGFCGFQTVLIRWLHPSVAYWQHASFDPVAVAKAIAHQSSAALPMSYFLADPLEIFPDPGAGGPLLWLWDGPAALVAGSAVVLCYRSLRAGNDDDGGPAPARIGRGWLAALGLILAVFPALMISISPYHRGMLAPGVGWIPVLIQYYGFGLLLAGGLWTAVRSTIAGGAVAAPKCVAASLLVGLLVGITYRANREVTLCFDASPGSRLYRDYVGLAGGGRSDERRLLEAALGAGLLDEVPDRSTVQLAREYPHWYDATFSPYFYAAYSGKALRTITPTGGAVSVGSSEYRVRDVLLGPGAGYVVLSRGAGAASAAAEPIAPGDLRVFVRHPDLARGDARASFRIDAPGGASQGPDCGNPSVVRSGRGWAIYALKLPAGADAPDSLRLIAADAPRGDRSRR